MDFERVRERCLQQLLEAGLSLARRRSRRLCVRGVSCGHHLAKTRVVQGALRAEGKVLLKLNVPREGLDAAVEAMPALHAPTVNQLSDPEWFSVESVLEESVVRDIIPKLKAVGAEGIIELALNKIVP